LGRALVATPNLKSPMSSDGAEPGSEFFANDGRNVNLDHQHRNSIHVLIAETDLELLDEMRLALEEAGHTVTAVTNGMSAWGHMTARRRLDLLITRLHLGAGAPPGTALGLCAQANDPPIPVLYIPADAEGVEFADPSHGAVLIKPFSVADLVMVASSLVR
jgi:DNA-binding response OmpR family regulator